MEIYAYGRVSARDQNLERQIASFLNFGVKPKNIYCDKKSGKNFERQYYLRLIKKLRPGDLVIIKSIDRLGRNYNMIIEEWSRITRNLQTDILVLDMPLLDTRTKTESLVGKFISDIVLQILSFVAENERENIRARQAKGIRLAKERGVRFGRPKKILPDIFPEIARQYYKNSITCKEACALLNMQPNNFYYFIKKYGQDL